jgi:uncharacterized caspase-like protein
MWRVGLVLVLLGAVGGAALAQPGAPPAQPGATPDQTVAPTPPVESSQPATRSGDSWAVVIGVGAGEYTSKRTPRRNYARADAEAMYQVLVGPLGFTRDHVILLTDGSERKPTFRNIKWALGTFLPRSAQETDTVLIYFAGPGAVEVDSRGLERHGLASISSRATPIRMTSIPLHCP